MPLTEFPLRSIPVPYIYRLDAGSQLNNIQDQDVRQLQLDQTGNGSNNTTSISSSSNNSDNSVAVPHGLATPKGCNGTGNGVYDTRNSNTIKLPRHRVVESNGQTQEQEEEQEQDWQQESSLQVNINKRPRNVEISATHLNNLAEDPDEHKALSKRQKLDPDIQLFNNNLNSQSNTTANGLIIDELTYSLQPKDGSESLIDEIRLNEPVLDDIKDTIIDDALPLSPMASLGRNSPVTKLDEDNNSCYSTDVKNDSHTTQLPLTMNQLATTLSTFDPTKIQGLAYAILSQLNRSQLTDLNMVIRDNLKRDLISTLPPEIASQILRKLSFKDIVACLSVSRQWNNIIENSPSIWKSLLISESFVSRDEFAKYEAEIRAKYTNVILQLNFDSIYKLEFLRNFRILQNWYNPKYLPLRTTLRGHMTSVVTCLQFEDNYIITGADDKMIRVYDAHRKKFLLQLAGHEGGVWALKYDADGIVVSGSTDRSVRVWDINRGCCLYVFKGHTSTVRCLDIVEFSGQKYIVTGSRDNTLHVWKLEKWGTAKATAAATERYPIVYDTPDTNPYFVGVLKGHVASVRSMAGYGNIVISGSYDNTLMVWDIAQMKCLYILSGHTDRIYSTIYDHKRHRCISASMDSTIRVWDLQHIEKNGSYEIVNCSGTRCTRITDSYKVLSGHTALVGLLRLSNKFLVSGAADGTLKGWDSEDYTLKFSYHHFNLSAITTFQMDDNILVSGSERQFNIYNLRSGKLVHSNILKDAEQIWSVNFKKNLLVAAIEKNNQSFVEILDFGGSQS